MDLIHEIVRYLLFGCLLIGFFGALAARFFYKITRVSLPILVPCTIAAASLGAYAMRNQFFDIGVMLAMGVLGHLLQKFNYPLTAVVLGLVLGPMAEEYFVQSVELTNWDFTVFFTRPICIVLWICIAATLFATNLLAKRNKEKDNPSTA
jgi:putative tricarboxylic transport membrane protein